MDFINQTLDLFFTELGGIDFISYSFGSIIIIAVIISILKPFK